MTAQTDAVEPEEQAETNADVAVELSAPDQLAYDELVEEFGQELIEQDLQGVVKEQVRSLYDNRDQIRQRIEQAKKQQQAAQQ